MKVEGGGGERTRLFSCLAVVRYTVATVLSVLAVAVVVMVIAVFLRPENIDIWILHGHVEAVLIPPAPASGKHGGQGFSRILQPADNGTVPRFVDLRVSLSANNPSGRADIYGDNITVGVLDMPFSSNFTGLVELLRVDLEAGNYSLKRESTHSLRKWAAVNDIDALSYIATRHRDATSFKAMLQVNTTISSVTLLWKTRPRLVTHYCWPVTVSLYAPRADQKAVGCTPSEDLYHQPSVNSPPPAPAPAPAGTSG